MTGGVIPLRSIEPSEVAKKSGTDRSLEALDRNWVQAMCAFQLVSVDLLVLAGVLYLLAFTEWLSLRQEIGFAMAGLFFMGAGKVWLSSTFNRNEGVYSNV